MDMSVGRLAEARGERRTRFQGAAIAGFITGACMIAVPTGLWELLFSSIGLSEFVPVLAPPVGWPVRIALALLAAIIAAAVAGGSGRDGNPARSGSAGRSGKKTMGWTQSLGLHHLARLARGGAEAVDYRVAVQPVIRTSRVRRTTQEKVQESLARRRADMHPDAPPRVPLMASRDLPVVTELTVVETASDSVPVSLPRIATPIRDTTDQIRPRPLPRAPEPLSDSDLNWVRGLLDMEEEEGEVVVLAEPRPTEPLSIILPEAGEASADDSLLSMLGRFEQGVAQRIALRDAADAKVRVEETMPASVPTSGEPVEPVVSEAASLFAEDVEVNAALNVALETLKKLSAKANGR